MNRAISTVSICAALCFATLWNMTPSAAADLRSNIRLQDQYITQFCAKYRGADQCNEWRADHTNWTSADYSNFYLRHKDDKAFATPAAAELFGVRPLQK